MIFRIYLYIVLCLRLPAATRVSSLVVRERHAPLTQTTARGKGRADGGLEVSGKGEGGRKEGIQEFQGSSVIGEDGIE